MRTTFIVFVAVAGRYFFGVIQGTTAHIIAIAIVISILLDIRKWYNLNYNNPDYPRK